MDILSKLIVYLASIALSIKYADGYWIVGAVFGIAVISYEAESFKRLNLRRHGLFLAASILIYALVYWVAMRKLESPYDILNYFIGPFPIGVVLGSILLPLAHQRIFEKPKAQAKRVIFALIKSFYLVMLLAYLTNTFWPEKHFNFAAVAITIWQGIYLYLFFIRQKSKI